VAKQPCFSQAKPLGHTRIRKVSNLQVLPVHGIVWCGEGRRAGSSPLLTLLFSLPRGIWRGWRNPFSDNSCGFKALIGLIIMVRLTPPVTRQADALLLVPWCNPPQRYNTTSINITCILATARKPLSFRPLLSPALRNVHSLIAGFVLES